MAQQMTLLQRQLEDMEKQARKEIDEKSMNHLRTLFGELRTVVDAVAKTNGFDLVLAYPDASTPEELNSPMYLEMKLRTPAAMPFSWMMKASRSAYVASPRPPGRSGGMRVDVVVNSGSRLSNVWDSGNVGAWKPNAKTVPSTGFSLTEVTWRMTGRIT